MTNSYSQTFPDILNKEERLRVGDQLLGVIKSQFSDLSKLNCLDVGCSGGTITHLLSQNLNRVVGIDVDLWAIEKAKKDYKKSNLEFIAFEKRFPFPNNVFDLVVCNQVYEFTPDQKLLADEIYRVLKPGGSCILGARNKLAFIEGQSGLPLLHLFPTGLASAAAKALGRNYYPANYLTRGELLVLFKRFEIKDITLEILKNPKKFGFSKLETYSEIAKLLPGFLVNLIPNFFFVCKKEVTS